MISSIFRNTRFPGTAQASQVAAMAGRDGLKPASLKLRHTTVRQNLAAMLPKPGLKKAKTVPAAINGNQRAIFLQGVELWRHQRGISSVEKQQREKFAALLVAKYSEVNNTEDLKDCDFLFSDNQDGCRVDKITSLPPAMNFNAITLVGFKSLRYLPKDLSTSELSLYQCNVQSLPQQLNRLKSLTVMDTPKFSLDANASVDELHLDHCGNMTIGVSVLIEKSLKISHCHLIRVDRNVTIPADNVKIGTDVVSSGYSARIFLDSLHFAHSRTLEANKPKDNRAQNLPKYETLAVFEGNKDSLQELEGIFSLEKYPDIKDQQLVWHPATDSQAGFLCSFEEIKEWWKEHPGEHPISRGEMAFEDLKRIPK